MRKVTISIVVAIFVNCIFLATVYNQTKPKSPTQDDRAKLSGSSTACLAGVPCRRAFPNSWDGVHQFVIGDHNIGMPTDTKSVPPEIHALLQPGAAVLDFVWGGDDYANCWAGSPTCLNLPPNPQHPIVGHYIPFAGIQMVEPYARCVDVTECDAAFPKRLANADGDLKRDYECRELFVGDASPEFKARNTFLRSVYTDAAGNQEKVCLKANNTSIATTAAQVKAIEFRYWRRVHPNWLLYRSAQETRVDPKTHETVDNLAWISDSLPLDVSNEAVRNEVLTRIEKWPHIKDYYGAISLDTVALAKDGGAHYRRCRKTVALGTCPNGWEEVRFILRGPTGVAVVRKLNERSGFGPTPAGYQDPAWADLVLYWVTEVRDKAHSLGLNLVVNVSYGADPDSARQIPATDSKLLQLLNISDGVFDETGFTNGYRQTQVNGAGPVWRYNEKELPGNNDPERKRWSNFSAYMLEVQKRGKPYFSKNTTMGPGVRLLDPQPEAQAIQWSLASFLLARGQTPDRSLQAIYMMETTTKLGDPLGYVPPGTYLSNALNPAIGHPCETEPKRQQMNVFTRKFSGGFVMVNANGPGGPSAPILLPGPPDYNVTWPWEPKVETWLPPETGAVILVTSGRLCGSDRAVTKKKGLTR